MHIVIAEFATPNFNFIACGTTAKQAQDALLKGWKRHCLQYPSADKEYASTFLNDVSYYSISPGECLRDMEII